MAVYIYIFYSLPKYFINIISFVPYENLIE